MPNKASNTSVSTGNGTATATATDGNTRDILNIFIAANSELKKLQTEQVQLLQMQQNEAIELEQSKPVPIVNVSVATGGKKKKSNGKTRIGRGTIQLWL